MGIREKIRPPFRRDFEGLSDAGYRYIQELAKILNHGGLYDKRDNASGDYDFELADLTLDTNWYELDLSNIVPDGARSVYLKIAARTSGATPLFISIAKPGEYYDAMDLAVYTNSANEFYFAYGIVDCSRDRKIEYHGSSSADWLTCNITVHGWFY